MKAIDINQSFIYILSSKIFLIVNNLLLQIDLDLRFMDARSI